MTTLAEIRAALDRSQWESITRHFEAVSHQHELRMTPDDWRGDASSSLVSTTPYEGMFRWTVRCNSCGTIIEGDSCDYERCERVASAGIVNGVMTVTDHLGIERARIGDISTVNDHNIPRGWVVADGRAVSSGRYGSSISNMDANRGGYGWGLSSRIGSSR